MENFTNVRLLISLAVYNGWGLFHADIPQAFLRSVCDAPIYSQLVRGVNLRSRADGTDPLQHGMALRLLKSLYRIKQAPQFWNKEITNFMVNESFGFTRASAKPGDDWGVVPGLAKQLASPRSHRNPMTLVCISLSITQGCRVSHRQH